MRIAFDYQIFVLQRYGGISRYFTRLAQGLLDMEQQVGIFSPLHRNNHLQSLPKDMVYGQFIKRYPPKTTQLFLAYNQFRSRFQLSKWKPDLVHETYFDKVSSAPRKCPTVITVHDMIHELYPDELPMNDNSAAIKLMAIERADHIICVSENTRRDLMRLYGTPANKLSVVHHGIDRFILRDDCQSYKTFPTKPFLLYVGMRDGYKNFSGFLKAIAASKKLISDFDIVAFGGPRFSSTELGLIHDLGFKEEQVHYKSGGDDILGNLYNTARAFVYPSIYEGFGIPPLEAMAHHCPVISSNTSSMPEVIGLAAEYFNPVDIDNIRCAIETVVYSDVRINELRKLGSEQLTYFSWCKAAQETYNIYQSLV